MGKDEREKTYQELSKELQGLLLHLIAEKTGYLDKQRIKDAEKQGRGEGEL